MQIETLNNIDTSIWITQQALADELTNKLGYKVSIQRVHNWVQRGKIDKKYLKEVNVTLVDRTSISIKTL